MCETRDGSNCIFEFFVKTETKNDKLSIVIGQQDCGEVNLYIIFGSVFGAVLLIGLLILLFIAIFKRCWRARELRRFQEKQQDPNNATIVRTNPLYKQAETSHNPHRTMSGTDDSPLMHSSYN